VLQHFRNPRLFYKLHHRAACFAPASLLILVDPGTMAKPLSAGRGDVVPVFKSTLSVLVLPFLVLPALAQPASEFPIVQQDGDLVLAAQAHELVLPVPDWIDADASDWADAVTPRFSDISNQAHLEIYPRGEGEAFWTRRYGARLTQLPQSTLVQFRAVIMDAYARSCRPEAIAFFQLEADQGDQIPPLGFVCGAYADPAAAGEGEVSILGFYKSDTGIAMIYEGWRGEAFDASRPENWPVSAEVVEAQVARLKTEAALTPAD
jgi:hypothetical protein